jgi:hypothetical protein
MIPFVIFLESLECLLNTLVTVVDETDLQLNWARQKFPGPAN